MKKASKIENPNNYENQAKSIEHEKSLVKKHGGVMKLGVDTKATLEAFKRISFTVLGCAADKAQRVSILRFVMKKSEGVCKEVELRQMMHS